MTPAEARQFMDSLARFGMRFGLERTYRVIEALGNPQERYAVLHVAGTNGKGSTCAFAASILRRAGHRVGLYTSPHLVRVNERIQVDGEEISDASFAEGVEAILRAFPQAQGGDDPLTFFELGTALALWHFAREQVDVAVFETGLGGRLDATNAVRPKVSAVTRIALDHTAVLGGTLSAIAGEKAGIFKQGTPVVIARQPPEALAVLEACARGVGQEPLVAGRDFHLDGDGPLRFVGPGLSLGELELGLAGPHQRENAETAIQASLLMHPGLGAEAIRQGLAATRWPGRLEIAAREPLTLLDGAHNPDGARALARAMRALYPRARVHLVFGALADKDVDGIFAELGPLAHRVYLASPRSERALALEGLERLAAKAHAPASAYPSIAEALERARAAARGEGEGHLVLVAGSLYVVGEARASLAGG